MQSARQRGRVWRPLLAVSVEQGSSGLVEETIRGHPSSVAAGLESSGKLLAPITARTILPAPCQRRLPITAANLQSFRHRQYYFVCFCFILFFCFFLKKKSGKFLILMNQILQQRYAPRTSTMRWGPHQAPAKPHPSFWSTHSPACRLHTQAPRTDES